MNLLIRADASVAMGTGHVMRCLALAQAWQDAGGRALFAMAESTPAVDARIASEQFDTVSISEEPENMRATIGLAREEEAKFVVLDGYQFKDDSQRALKAAGLKVLAIDDCGHASGYVADVVLNQNISADEALYQEREPDTRLLLGPRYALLRREFAAWRHWTREVAPHPQRLLIMIGGSDPQNVTARVIEAVESAATAQFDTTVVVGASNPHLVQLQEGVARSRAKIRLIRDPANLPTLMVEADVAISAAGSTCWELCFLALPVLLIDIAPNQTALAKELQRRQCAIHVGDSGVSPGTLVRELQSVLASQECRNTLSQNSRRLVDGNGARRVVSALCEGRRIWLRPLDATDRQILFEWANDPAVRAASFSSEAIAWETHAKWFDVKLASVAAGAGAVFIAEDENGTPVGQIRFDIRPDGDWEVDVSLAASIRGRGLASELIRRGVETMRREGNRGRIHALVKESNLASLRAFDRSVFTRQGAETVAGHHAVHMIYQDKESPLAASRDRGKN